MPFLDLHNLPAAGLSADFDVVITGAGAAGILLAVKLSEKKKKVLLLESGHFELDESRQELNTVVQTGKFLSNAVWGRKRAIGGTTIAWGGQSLPFSPIDFEKRSWVCNSGWPINYTDLHEYYKQANSFMKIDTQDYEEDIFRLLRMKRVAFDDQLIRYHFSKWAPEPNFKKLYAHYLEQNVTVVYNAVVTAIQLNEQGRADTIEVSDFAGKRHTVKTAKLIIAAGGIETNRILLSNNQQVEGGIGNHSGWLGKCFMDHPCIKVGTITTHKPFELQSYFNTHIINKRRYSIRMSAATQMQRSHNLLNGSAGIMFAYPDEGNDPYLEIKRFLSAKKLSSLKVVAGNFNTYIRAAYAYVNRHFVYKHKAEGRVVLMMEQEPVRESYIGLTSEKDRFGIPKAVINWTITRKTWDAVVQMTSVLSSELQRLSFGTVHPEPGILKNNEGWMELLSDVNHHMGGARMSETASDGVVNKDLQVWGHDNIYICSSAVFPTGSHSNPTLTLLALAQRLADKLTAN